MELKDADMHEVTASDLDRIASPIDALLFVEDSATIAEAATKMSGSHVGSVLVRSRNGSPVGILTERDVLRRVVAQGRNPFAVIVSTVMSPELIYCHQDTKLTMIQQTMACYQIRHVPIVEDGKAIGIVTSRDIHAYELEKAQGLASRPIMLSPGSQEGADGNELPTRT